MAPFTGRGALDRGRPLGGHDEERRPPQRASPRSMDRLGPGRDDLRRGDGHRGCGTRDGSPARGRRWGARDDSVPGGDHVWHRCVASRWGSGDRCHRPDGDDPADGRRLRRRTRRRRATRSGVGPRSSGPMGLGRPVATGDAERSASRSARMALADVLRGAAGPRRFAGWARWMDRDRGDAPGPCGHKSVGPGHADRLADRAPLAGRDR